MKARLIQSIAGEMIVTEFAAENLIPAMSVRGFNQNGTTGRPLRTELHGLPTFSGLNGPMYDGDFARYEDIDTYNTLSK